MTTPEDAPVVYVDLYQTSIRPRPINDTRPPRPQRWRWRALNSGNGKVMAIASEAYTNRQDCIDSAVQLFGKGTTVYFREAEHGNELLRMAVRDEQ